MLGEIRKRYTESRNEEIARENNAQLLEAVKTSEWVVKAEEFEEKRMQ